MNKTSYLVNRFFVHLRQGTLPKWIKEAWYQRVVMRRRIALWNSNKDKEEYFTFPLQRGIKINLYFDSLLCRLIYCDNFEWRERQFINSFLRRGDVFVDVGANIGLYTLIASLRVGGSGKVFAFEPCEKTFRRLVRNIELNGLSNINSYQMALSDRSGQIQMYSSLDGYDAWNSMAPPYTGSAFDTETVSAVTWDDFVREHNLIGQVTLMKIDVEGWENKVLSGGIEMFKRPDAPVLQIEFTDQASQAAGTSCQALYHKLEEIGYSMYFYDEKADLVVPDPIRRNYPYVNLLAIKNVRDVNLRLSSR